ncbi:MAG: hypothetical protein QME66_05960 [Candidatus Eisenbacteria bacterium]|nr:hypothetical protein [Candidatus Eisenbacteria bacterium]
MSQAWVQEILEKTSTFERDHGSHLRDWNRNDRLYRSIPVKSRSENQSNTFIPEMFVEVEALATAVFEMVMSDTTDALFFDVVGQDGTLDDTVRAMVTKATLAKQIEVVELQSKLMPFFRGLILQGSQPISLPWRVGYKSYYDRGLRKRVPAFDSWDFLSVKIFNFAFDDAVDSIENASWAAQTMHVNAMSARRMAKNGIWSAKAVDKALPSGIMRNPHEEESRRTAGYLTQFNQGKGLTAVEYFGTLESKDDGEIYWAVASKNGQPLKEPELNPYGHGELQWMMARWFTVAEEPLGIGIGHVNYRQQAEINDRRNFINDLLYASLYSMWLKRSDSGIMLPGNKMRYSPHQILEGDIISDEALRPLRPDMSGLSGAINLEAGDIERMRRHSGATSTLQAQATGITATETTAIQSEATRRVKAMVRSELGGFLRKMLYRAHALNLQLMDRPLIARIMNSDGLEVFGEVTNRDLILNPDIRIKLTTDLDFRPFKRRELIEMLEVFARLSQTGVLGSRRLVPDPIVEELARTYGMDPRKFFSRDGVIEAETRRATQSPDVQQNALQQLMAESPGAQEVLASGMASGVPAGAI